MKHCIDPGHSDKTIGAVGPTGLRETDVVLNVALRAGYHLKRHGEDVIYTRTNCTHKELSERVNIANKVNCDTFTSIHLDSAANRTANGTTTFCYKFGGQGEILAKNIHTELISALGRYNRGVKEGNFEVIRNTKMPAVLCELLFVSNPQEESFIREKINQEKAAVAIAKGILKTVGKQWQEEVQYPDQYLVYGAKLLGNGLTEDYAKTKAQQLKDQGYIDVYYIRPDGTKVNYK